MRAIIGWPLLIIAFYMGAALLGSMIPTNSGWQQPADGIDIFVETNGIHVSLIVPITAEGEDLSDLIRPGDLTNPDLFGTHVMVGWGHGNIYRNTPTWDDLRVKDAFSAIFGSGFTTLHIYHLTDPRPTPYRKKFRVSHAQFRHIMGDIRAKFTVDQNGRSIPHPGYAPDNLFYDSFGRYSAFNTCNNWTAKVLRDAGVRIGVWTPMAGGVMRWF